MLIKMIKYNDDHAWQMTFNAMSKGDVEEKNSISGRK